MSADINKVWWLHMHTFLPGRRVAFLGRPSQRLSLPTYWFIRGDLEPLCHMLPQMGTSPQAIQALWQQAWTIMDAKGKRQNRALSAPQTAQIQCACIHMHMYGLQVLCFCTGWAWFDAVFAFVWLHAPSDILCILGRWYRNYASTEAPLYLTHVMVQCVW